MTNEKVVTSIAIESRYLKKMDEIKADLGIPKNKVVNQALKEYFENHDFSALGF